MLLFVHSDSALESRVLEQIQRRITSATQSSPSLRVSAILPVLDFLCQLVDSCRRSLSLDRDAELASESAALETICIPDEASSQRYLQGVEDSDATATKEARWQTRLQWAEKGIEDIALRSAADMMEYIQAQADSAVQSNRSET